MPPARRLANELVHLLGVTWKVECVRRGHLYLINSDGLVCVHCGRFWKVLNG